MQLKTSMIAAGSLFLIISCKSKTTADAITNETPKGDVIAMNMDTTVSPGEDFFMYANGGWIKNSPIPNAESSWGVGNLVDEEIYKRKKDISEAAAAKNAAQGTMDQKIGDFWTVGMDSVKAEQLKLSPLKPDFDQIDAMKTTDDLVAEAARLHNKGINVMFRDDVGQDDKNSEAMAYWLVQGGLGLPNREYYFNTDERTVNVRKGYKDYLVKTFRLLGADSMTAGKNATAVYDLEMKLATASRKIAALRDPEKNYNKMSLAKLNEVAPNLKWNAYLPDIGVKNIDSVIVGQPEFYTALSKEVAATPIENWKNYFKFHVVNANASYLDSTTYNNFFEYRKLLTGASEKRPRWKQVLDAEERAIGEQLGQLFVKEYFNEKTKKRYADLVESIRDAYRERITKLTWMSDSTKQKAIEKLNKITPKVGYPDKWKDFSALQIEKDAYVLNFRRAMEWWHNYNINKLGKPVDRTEWGMTPQTYNAYYNPSNNEIVLPAGIFAVPGFRDEQLDDAFVYGYAGASTIGHEITHGFDDQGRQYDVKGNLFNWWSRSDSTEFVTRAKNIIRQFNEFNPVDTLHINGEATQGENIADLGGLLIGLDAFKKTDAYKKGEKIAGLTPLQRFFLGYAYGWMYSVKKESLANNVMTDVHAPAKERVNGPMVNIPEFYQAFNIKPGDKMYRPDSLRVNIW